MLQIAICDDNLATTTEIESLLMSLSHKLHIPVNIDIFFDGSALCKSIGGGNAYELVYLDIEMDGLDGIETAHFIRDLEHPSLIIYISSHETYYKQLFDVEPFRFLSKPIDVKLFEKYFTAAHKRISAEKQFFCFSFNQRSCKLPIADILYFESKGRSILIHTKHHEHRYLGKLNDIHSTLLNIGVYFLRIHQSYLINPYHICSICLSEVVLYPDIALQISQKYQKEVQLQYLRMTEDL